MPYTNEARSAEFLGLWPQTKRKCLGFGAMLLNPPNTIYTLHILIYLMLTNVLSFLRGLRFYLIYPPKGVCESRSPEGVHFSKLFQERNLTLQFQELISAFLKSQKCFIPRREMRSISSKVPIVFTYVLFPEGRYAVSH